MKIGTYYYPDQWPRDQWERDFNRMASMKLQIVHMAEFAWATIEPREGDYRLDWLDECLERPRDAACRPSSPRSRRCCPSGWSKSIPTSFTRTNTSADAATAATPRRSWPITRGKSCGVVGSSRIEPAGVAVWQQT
jgi:hypothetical protein